MGKPIADPGMKCPLWRKDVSKVCHTCAWYGSIAGKHPQTGQPVDQWQCAITLTVLSTLETAKATHEAGATTQELRNDLYVERTTQTRLLMSRVNPVVPQLGNNNNPLRLTDDGHNDG